MTTTKGVDMSREQPKIVIVDDDGVPLVAPRERSKDERRAMDEYVDHVHEFHPDVCGGGGPPTPPCAGGCVPYPEASL